MKPPFKDMYIDTAAIFSVSGNKIRVLQPIVVLVTDEEQHNAEALKKRSQYQEVYDKYIKPGQLFKPAGKGAVAEVVAQITRLNPKTKTLSWRQTNFEELKTVYKYSVTATPAKGKWLIIAMIQLHLRGQIKFL